MGLFLKRIGWPYWVISLILGVIIPYILERMISFGAMVHLGIIFGILYTICAGVMGWAVKRRGQSVWFIWILPVIYAVGLYFVGPLHATYFAPVYLCVAYLAYGLSAAN
ncbi:hypothetical protein AYR62_05140 [Secundilactobacillus paracollinoides]|uniref:Uncharacterized protein n=1 Tax=Secundilactobacillus paracollinoides TaxID=240427 RepID=A0A1B2J0J9_9LACO|nr:hypothetical protein [Secundilactobacillus paracollinoides]ANZ61897.1 hypothetical protein AYR61_11405 [Secundilactobacillus paracollinoides]ANZ63536.1 hypothetical protein AYR62_05140 [Secundilactobacillus paracollinoides]ANZ67817.1 hypothetical protein AYR63_12165 [Secundilactobacillus paracollinoides]